MTLTAQRLAYLAQAWTSGPGPAHERLSRTLRLLILDGLLPIGTDMPSERSLADAMSCSRTTIGTCYQRLIADGFLTSRERHRSRVCLPNNTSHAPRESASGNYVVDFASASPPAPRGVLTTTFADAIQQLPNYYGDPGYSRRGTVTLRSAVSSWYERRGLPTQPDHILITHGAQHALTLIIRAFLHPHDHVLIDHPTYPNALSAFRQSGARLVPIALDDHEWDLARWISESRAAQLAYIVPDFHNPTGLHMEDEQRKSLALQCRTVVDETLADINLSAAEQIPVAAYHPHAISVGSASKSMWGGLRVGWIRADVETIDQLDSVRTTIDLGSPVMEQLATASLLNAQHHRRIDDLTVVRAQRDTLISLLADVIPELTVNTPPGGLALWARLPSPIAVHVAATAPDYGVKIAAGPRFGVGGAFARHLRLPYTLNDTNLDAAVTRLRLAIDAVHNGARGTHRPTQLT